MNMNKQDKTRIVTLMLNNDLSQMNFKFVEGVRGALHLDLTHNGHAPALEDCPPWRETTESRSGCPRELHGHLSNGNAC